MEKKTIYLEHNEFWPIFSPEEYTAEHIKTALAKIEELKGTNQEIAELLASSSYDASQEYNILELKALYQKQMNLILNKFSIMLG